MAANAFGVTLIENHPSPHYDLQYDSFSYPTPFFGMKVTGGWQERAANYYHKILYNIILVDFQIQMALRLGWAIVSSKGADLHLINFIAGLDYSRPLSPKVRYVGSLNPTLYSFAKNGYILLSFGSVGMPEYFRVELLLSVLEDAVHQGIVQKVIWISANHTSEYSKYTWLERRGWENQTQLIQEIKFNLIISHGGANSVMEAVSASIPLLLLPTFGDQYDIASRIERVELGIAIRFESTREQMKEALNQVMLNSTFQRNAQYWGEFARKESNRQMAAEYILISAVIGTRQWEDIHSLLSIGEQYVGLFTLLILGLFLRTWKRC